MARAGLTVHKNSTTEKITKDEATGKLTLHTKDGQALGDLDVVLMAIGKKTSESVLSIEMYPSRFIIDIYPSRSIHRDLSIEIFPSTGVLFGHLSALLAVAGRQADRPLKLVHRRMWTRLLRLLFR